MAVRNNQVEKAIEKSKEFFGFEPRQVGKTKLYYPRALFSLGACVRVDYFSDKFDGKPRVYFHDFEPESCTELLASPEVAPDGTQMLIIIGKFKLTEDGIEG